MLTFRELARMVDSTVRGCHGTHLGRGAGMITFLELAHMVLK